MLRVAFTNEADEAREFAFGSLVPWDGLLGQHEDGTSSLLLSPGIQSFRTNPTRTAGRRPTASPSRGDADRDPRPWRDRRR